MFQKCILVTEKWQKLSCLSLKIHAIVNIECVVIISSVNNLTPIYKIGRPVSSTTKYLSQGGVDTFERSKDNQPKQVVSNEIEKRAYIPTEEFQKTITTLNSMQTKAENTYQNQMDSTGWCGRFADKLSTLWGSKNRSSVVSDDLQKSRAEIENLQTAAYKGNFRSEFFNTFGVNYDKKNIDEFEQKSAQYTLIQASSQMAKIASDELREHIKFFDKHADSINPEAPDFNPNKKHPDIAGKMEEYKQSLEKYVGGKENLQNLANSKRRDFVCLSREEQIGVYNEIAEGLIYTYSETANKLKNGKTDEEIKKDYDEAYVKAFGKKNNIQKRVNDYVRAQQIRTVAVSDLAVSGMIGAAIALSGTSTPALLGAGLTTASYIGLDISELATNKIDNSKDLNKENIKDIVKCSLISGAEYLVGSKMYDIIPEARTGKKILDSTLNVARTLGIELSVAFVSEYMQTGEWATYQIDPKSFVKLTLATFAAEELTRMGLSAPAGKKSDYTPSVFNLSEQSMESFSISAKKELEKQFAENPAKVMNLKLISVQNPDLFKELMTNTLTEMAAA